ncbi:MAG: transcription termination/antitermination protein NusA, partial [Verrucomicrobia bacterium]|nr:transcription termination/antitermination protein NusA [Verrucomicrobiota bacterium]
KVDIIRWKSDPAEFIREALKPIKVLTIQVNNEKKEARLTVSEEDLSKAIGRRGQNARLTSRLVGMDLIIEKDQHAAEVFEGQMGSAVHHLVDALGITEETARLLTQGGMGDLATLTSGVDVADIADVLGGDTALAEQIFEKAQAHASPEK